MHHHRIQYPWQTPPPVVTHFTTPMAGSVSAIGASRAPHVPRTPPYPGGAPADTASRPSEETPSIVDAPVSAFPPFSGDRGAAPVETRPAEPAALPDQKKL
jgi:hypothetical protein